MNVLALVRDRFGEVLSEFAADSADLLEMVLPSQDPKFGDYQANFAMPLAKHVGKPPREVASELVQHVRSDDFCLPPEIAGPGFINLRIRDDWLVDQLQAVLADTNRLGIAPVADPETIVIDYSAPNVAKPMHVGHIRSTVIGDALYRVLRFLGHRVISDNHIGDWGTQFGMIIYGYKNFLDVEALRQNTVAELTRLYKLVNRLVEYHATKSEKIPAARVKLQEARAKVGDLAAAPPPEDPKKAKQAAKKIRQAEGQVSDAEKALVSLEATVAEVNRDEELSKLAATHPEIGKSVLEETAKLHAGDATNRSLWKDILPACLEEINATYRRLGVAFNHTLGESFYQDQLADVVNDLTERGIATESDGAKCIFLDGYQAPFIVQKRDGAFLYATTDLATIRYRMKTWQPDTILYVVDHRQAQHFEQLFSSARLWGIEDVALEHISFGTVLGENGKPYKTRTGTSVGLMGLLDEAVERAHRIVCENDDNRDSPVLNESERRTVAEKVGIGAIKYADLSHNRTSDYVFSYDKMLATTGNAAAYMQYSYARVASIFSKCGTSAEEVRSSTGAISLDTAAERELGLAILQFAEALDRVVEDYRPNHLTSYLFDLAGKYAKFYESCPVRQAESDELRTSRLKLCDLTARTIQTGLSLLGIEIVERM